MRNFSNRIGANNARVILRRKFATLQGQAAKRDRLKLMRQRFNRVALVAMAAAVAVVVIVYGEIVMGVGV